MTDNKKKKEVKTDPDVRINRKDIRSYHTCIPYVRNLGRNMEDIKKT